MPMILGETILLRRLAAQSRKTRSVFSITDEEGLMIRARQTGTQVRSARLPLSKLDSYLYGSLALHISPRISPDSAPGSLIFLRSRSQNGKMLIRMIFGR